MTLDQILENLGGETAVARSLGCLPSAVSNWKARGIPKARWVDLVELSAETGTPLNLAALREAHRLIKQSIGTAA